ncbi:unnamed protein product [Camellia sinensis]
MVLVRLWKHVIYPRGSIIEKGTRVLWKHVIYPRGSIIEKFPTPGFIVERYWEIQAHESEEFWTINCTHNSDEGTATRGNMFDYTCVVIIYEMCVQEPTATVTKVRQQEKLKYPPHPLNTIELEKRASRYFRMSSEQTMKVAEDLYQTGFISYPRTETDSFSERTDLRKRRMKRCQSIGLEAVPCIGALFGAMVEARASKHENMGEFESSHFEQIIPKIRQLCKNRGGILYGVHMLNAYWTLEKDFGGTLVMDDDKAHPPIHPTKFSGGQSGWSQDHHRLYELFVRHFLACVSKPAVGAETTVEIDIAGEMFSASGKVILERKLLAVPKVTGVTKKVTFLQKVVSLRKSTEDYVKASKQYAIVRATARTKNFLIQAKEANQFATATFVAASRGATKNVVAQLLKRVEDSIKMVEFAQKKASVENMAIIRAIGRRVMTQTPVDGKKAPVVEKTVAAYEPIVLFRAQNRSNQIS